MVNLPNFKDRVRVWPHKGTKIQASQVPILDGGAFLSPAGKMVEWSPFWHARLLAGEILLHDPRTAAEIEADAKKAAAKAAEPEKAAEAPTTTKQPKAEK